MPKKNKAVLDYQGNPTPPGIPCRYAKFAHPVPPGMNLEPVYEFSTSGPTSKYIVESMFYTPTGLEFSYKGEENIVPLGNVVFVRCAT